MRPIPALLAASLLAFASPVVADEIEDTLEAALEAYRAGDIALAKEEIDFAAQLIAQQKADGLAAFLPKPLPGWTMEEGDTNAQTAAMFGGGLTASADYSNGSETVSITMMAENQMVATMGAMFANPAMMGAMGRVKRIGRQRVVLTDQGELNAFVDNRVLIQMSGSAPAETLEAFFEAIDIDALKAF
ncbi:MAG: hypothetical protein AAF074_22165 [Pseudomonadota bacterium]